MNGPKGVRDVAVDAAADLDGLWVAAGLGDAPTDPPTMLGWQLILDDATLLGSALARRGASLPRLSRRLVRIGGHAYHAFGPLTRAARTVVPLQGATLALAIAGEARQDARVLAPHRERIGTLGVSRLAIQAARALARIERGVFRHERDAAQHYRWLVEMDLGILPDDALGTTLEECAAIQRATRTLEIEATLDLLAVYGALVSFAEHVPDLGLERLATAALVPDALELPSATPALALTCVAQVELRRQVLGPQAPRSAAIAEFLEAFGERGPREREPSVPRWREQPERLAQLVTLLAHSHLDAFETRLSQARHERDACLRRVFSSLGPLDRPLFRSLLASAQKLVVLRSRLHLVRARTLAMLRTAVLDVDRRLARLIGTQAGSAFFLDIRELRDSTVRPRSQLGTLARERRAAWSAARQLPAPPAVLGRAAWPREPAAPLIGIGVGAGAGELSGRVHVARNFDAALTLSPGAVLVTRSLGAGWAPLLPAAAAVITDAGGITEEGTLVAMALGVPLVIGTGDATRRLVTGDAVNVDLRAGTVTRV